MRLAMVDFVFLCFFLAMMLSGIAWSRVGWGYVQGHLMKVFCKKGVTIVCENN
jgi:F420-0:gamma-glutamyl ligase-like protein